MASIVSVFMWRREALLVLWPHYVHGGEYSTRFPRDKGTGWAFSEKTGLQEATIDSKYALEVAIAFSTPGEVPLSWEFAKPENAIERVRVEVTFKDQVPSKVIESIGKRFDGMRSQLRFSERRPHTVTNIFLNPPAAEGLVPPMPAASHQSGWVSVREKRPGEVVEAFSIDSGTMIHELTDYSTWEKTHQRFQSVSQEARSVLADVVDINSVVHDYFDRFVYSGVPSSADPASLIDQKVLTLVSDDARSGQELWHVHRGWFETIDGARYLVNQNIDAQEGRAPGGRPTRQVQVYTKVERRAISSDLAWEGLPEILVPMHRRCNQVFASILTPEYVTRMGLSEYLNAD
jgi:uncharacterized protein (TIGR04255 family)